MKEFTLRGAGGYEICVGLWDRVEAPVAVIQIAHGMAEHIRRYGDFANYLNRKGYIVLGDDHRGHGKTAQTLGVMPEGDCFEDTVSDMIALTAYAKETYGLPVVLFGHSYGSFLSQRYIERNGEALAACVLCGTAQNDGLDIAAARAVSSIQYAMGMGNKPAKLIRKLSFGMYDRKFPNEGAFAWGSRSEAQRARYLGDAMCDFTLSVAFYKYFMRGLKTIYRKKALARVSAKLPIFIIAGDKDPVGKQGKLVQRLFDTYHKLGVENVQIKLYPGARHEILNEINNDEVYDDVTIFLKFALK